MVDEPELHGAVRQLMTVLAAGQGPEELFDELTAQAVVALGCRGAGVSLRTGQEGPLRVAAASTRGVSEVERQQITTSQGPCHDAFHTRQVVVSADLGDEARWPAFAAAALEQNLRAVMGVPLVTQGEALGALDLYWETPHLPGDSELRGARLLADTTAACAVSLLARDQAEQLTDQLQHALDSRVLIEQAKGLLAERHGILTAEAFKLLRQHARSHSRGIHQVAAEIVIGELEL